MDQPPVDQPDSVPPTKASRPVRRFMLWRVFVLGRAHRRWRWVLRIVAAAFLLLLTSVVLLTHSPLTKRLILPRLESICGMHIEADSVHIRRSGEVVIFNAEVTIPGVNGQAGRFFRIARLQAGVDWISTLKGTPLLTSVTAIDPVMIISQSVEDGSLNLASIPLPKQAGGTMEVPGITLSNLGLEMGEHTRTGYRALKRIQMDGALTPVADKPGTYDVHLQETNRKRGPRAPPGPGFNLDGVVTKDELQLNLVNFTLTDWPATAMPSSIREIAAKLSLTGQVPHTRFTFNRTDGITAKLDLRGVAMNLPVGAEVQGPVVPTEDEPAPVRWMRMSGVDGSIVFARNSVTAKVGGLIEDLPYTVTLRYDGVDEKSAFDLDFVSQDFPLDKNPELLVYAPPMVKYYLKEVFLRPTGIVTTNVKLKRGPPTMGSDGQPIEPGPITVSGSVDFHDGTVAYEGFPYQFESLSGRFEFDNNRIQLMRIAGVSPTGAKLLANGLIAPLDDSSEVDISIDVTDAQIDEAMQAAFGPDRSKVISALFNEARHKQLIEAGLIRTPEQAAEEKRELDQLAGEPDTPERQTRMETLQEREQVPVFAFRGSANVSVHVHSPRGVNAPYMTSVDISLPLAGMVAEKFPYPIVASDVRVEVRNTEGKLTWGSFKGVNGGRAEIEAYFTVPRKTDADQQVRPDINITVSDMPMDPLMIFALPGANGEGGNPVKRILRQLGVTGAGSGKVHIAPRSSGADSDLGFDADIDLTSGDAVPVPFKGSGVVGVAGLTGHFEASEKKLFLDLDGVPVLAPPPAGPAPTGPPTPLIHAPRVGGSLSVHVRGEFPPAATKEPASFFVASTCPSFDLSAPFESVVGVFSEKAGDAVGRARKEYNPNGFVDMRTVVDAPPRQVLSVRVDLNKGRALSATVLNDRLLIPESTGTVSILSGGYPGQEGALPHAQFDAVSGAILFGGQGAGIASIDGSLPIGDGAANVGALEVTLLDARMESSLTRAILEQRLGADAISMYQRVKPSGLFDATITLRPDQKPGATGLIAQGIIEPRSLALHIGDQPVPFTGVSGSLEFEPGSGVLRALVLENAEWSCQVDGGWTLSPDGKVMLRTALSARGNKLSDDLRAILPPELSTLLDDLKFKLTGPFRLSDATLDLSRDGGSGSAPPRSAAQFAGRFDFTDAALEVGVPISDMAGALLVRFDNGGGKPEFRLDLKADRFDVVGISLRNGRAIVQSGSQPGQIRVPEAYGVCHGGHFSVRADVAPDSSEPGSPRLFHADFQFAGVRFGTLLRDLIDAVKPFVGPPAPLEADPVAEGAPDPARADAKDDFSRGLMDGQLTLEGVVADPATRRGRGVLRISGGRVLNLPVVTAFIEASNLQFPFNSKLDFAQAKFFLEGGLITFEDLSVQSRAIELVGAGTMTWPDRELDLRFISRAARPIPILSDIIQGIRNELIVTTVTGKLGEQVMGLQTPGPSRMLDGSGGRESRQSRDRADAERRAAAQRERDRREGRGIGPEQPPRAEQSGSKEP